MAAIYKLAAKSLTSLPTGKHGDGGGLYFLKSPSGSGSWVFRYTRPEGGRTEMGLGPFPIVSLKAAREQASKWRTAVYEGKNPRLQRERERREATRNLRLLKDIAKDAFEAHRENLKGDGKAGRWFSPLELHVLPRLGKIPVSEIDQVAIRDCLKPIWKAKPVTAVKAIQRLGLVLDHAAALGLDVDLQAVKKAKKLLGAQGHEAQHIPAMPWREVPAFYRGLTEPTPINLALKLLILTGLRSAPVRNMHLEHIDGDVLTVPGHLMKSRRGKAQDFQVPLSAAALAVIGEAQHYWERGGLLFPGRRTGVINDMSLSRSMERQGLPYRPHGFRSSLREFLAEQAQAPRDIAEMCLAHTVGNRVEQAYQRSQLVEVRRGYMDQWAEFVVGKAP